jgi:nucleotide-binding universal stress UspA family protein
MIKRILIPLDVSSYTDTALQIGTMIARMNNAEITGMVVLDLPGIEKSVGPVPAGGLYFAERLEKSKEKEAREHTARLLDKFRKVCGENGVVYREAERQGTPSELILRESIFYDLVLIGLQTYYRYDVEGNPGNSLDEILDNTITPVYGVPPKFSFPDIPKEKIRAAIAFDGSFPAARALQRFAQLAKPDLFEVKIVMSHPEKEVADYYLEQAKAYLNAHSIEDVETEWTPASIIDEIEEKYREWAHILVVGAHSKKGLFDFMVGSLTNYLIKRESNILLIGQ